MSRYGYLVFAIVAYGVSLLSLAYLVGFLADLAVLPRTVDQPPSALPLTAALPIDLALVGVFGLQHSVMARQGFKQWWTRIVPKPIERSAYLLFSSAALILLFVCWQPMPAPVWDVHGSPWAILLWALFIAGWLLAVASTYLISHWELFGLAQVWDHWRGTSSPAPRFRQPLFYRLVRHPLYSGFLLAFWATPAMSLGHLVFAAAMTGYIVLAIEWEERDLLRLFGADYEDYRRRVGKLAPRLR